MSKLNILIVDDDVINRKLIHKMLQKHSNLVGNIYEAKNGAEALVKKDENKDINMILLDIIMPVMDGKEFLKLFRSNTLNSNVPVIVLTTDDSQKSEVLNYGADDIIIKPIKEDELLKHIKYWVKD